MSKENTKPSAKASWRKRQIDGLNAHAESLLRRGSIPEAIEVYEKALLLDQSHIKTLTRLGMIYAKQSDHPEVAYHYLWRAYDETKARNRGYLPHPALAKELGYLHLSQEQFSFAREKFAEAARADSTDAEALSVLDVIDSLWGGVERALSNRAPALK